MQIDQLKIQDTREVMDGNEYSNCTFRKCTLAYLGGAIPGIKNCSFEDCEWRFEEAAERTLIFMRLLYHGMGANGPELIESAITSIREPIPQAPASAEGAPR